MSTTPIRGEPNQLRRFPHWGDACAAVAYVVVALVVYHKAWLIGDLYFGGDLAQYHGPYLQFIGERLSLGRLPHWNPYLYGGTPFIPTPQSGVFYPPNWLAMFLSPAATTTVLLIAHLTLAGILVYCYCRMVLRVGPAAAFVAALIFSFAGNLPGHHEHTALVISGAWLPGVLLACGQGLVTGRTIWHVAGGAMLGMAILGGGIQFVYLMCLAVFIYYAGHLIWPFWAPAICPRPKSEQPASRQPQSACMLARSRTIFVGLATVVLTAAAIGCAQLAPTVGFIPFSLRSGGMDLESATVYSLPPRYGLIFALCPDLFGVAGRYWGQWSQTELAMYLGLAPVALLPIALRRWRLLNVSFLWFILVASLVLAFGSHTVAFSIAYEHLPGLSFFRVPGRFLYLYSFAGAALAAVAFHELTELGRRTYFAIVAFNAAAWIIIALACYRLLTAPQLVDRLVRIAFDDSAPRQILARLQLVEHFKSIEGVHEHYWHLSLRIIAIWALILAAVLLARMKPKTAQIAIAAIAAIDILLFARALPVWGLAGAGQEHTAAPSWISSLQKSRYRGELPHSLLPPNIGMLHRLKIWDGYDPLLPQHRYTQLTSAGEGNRERLQELFAIRYVATPAPQATDNYHSALNSIVIQLRDDVPPRALVVDHATIVSNEREALERVLNDEFNIHRSVVLEPLDRESVQSAPTTAEPNVQQSRADADRPRPEPVVQWDTDDPDKLVLRVWSDRPAWLVVQDAYWPKWRAWVNGEATAIRRANFYFRAVPVPRGDSVVEMQYRDPVAWAAILVSVAGLGCVLVLTVREWARRRRLRSGIAVELSTSVPEM